MTSSPSSDESSTSTSTTESSEFALEEAPPFEPEIGSEDLVFTEAVALGDPVEPDKINLPSGCSMEHFRWSGYSFWKCVQCGFETQKRAEAERFALLKHAAAGIGRITGQD